VSSAKTILVCPLDWGLGHATRCIPLIHSFLAENHTVIIGTSGKQEALLKKEFPTLQFINLEGYNVEYPQKGGMTLKILMQLPQIKKAIKQEHEWLDKIIDEYNIDQVVADNRYGLWSNKIESVLVTHQIFIKAPVGEWVIEKMLQQHLNNFNEIWIPDVEGEDNLSGDLAHKKPLPDNYKFIGSLSRFSSSLRENRSNLNQGEYDFIAIISGPEPQRTIFEKLIVEQVKNTNLKGVLLRGLPDDNIIANCEERNRKQSAAGNEITSSVSLPLNDENLLIFNHLETDEFLTLLQKSKVIISRSGYSTIMDLTVLDKKAVFVPTPGQTEQEYLAEYHNKRGIFGCQKQSDFDLVKAINKVKKLPN